MSDTALYSPLTVIPQGDANFYAVKSPNRWVAIVQLNGELSDAYQLGLINDWLAAPELIAALERIADATVDGGTINTIAREALAKAGAA